MESVLFDSLFCVKDIKLTNLLVTPANTLLIEFSLIASTYSIPFKPYQNCKFTNRPLRLTNDPSKLEIRFEIKSQRLPRKGLSKKERIIKEGKIIQN